MYFHSQFSYDSAQNSLVKWTSNSYTFQSYCRIGMDGIKVGELVCDAVYLNPFDYPKQWYTTYEKKWKKMSG